MTMRSQDKGNSKMQILLTEEIFSKVSFMGKELNGMQIIVTLMENTKMGSGRMVALL